MEKSRTHSSIRNVYFSLFSQFTTILLNYVGRFFFVKILSQEYLGVNGLFTNILTIFSLAELGIGSAIVFAMYKPIADNDIIKIKAFMEFYRKCYSIIALIVFLFGLILIPNLNIFINGNSGIANLKLIYFLYLLDSVFSYLCIYKISILNAMQENYINNFYQTIGKIIMTIMMITSLFLFHNFLLYLIIQITFKLLINILISHKADKLYPYIKNTKGCNLEKEDKKNIFKNVYSLFCTQIGNVLVNGTDNIIMSKFINLATVGIYSNYYLVIGSLSNVIGQIFNSIIASVGNLAASKEIEKIFKTFNRMHFINFVVSFFSVTILACCLNDFILLSYGSKYKLDNYTVTVIIINFYLLSIKNVVGTFKYALGIFWEDKYCTFIRAIINLIISIILVKYIGIVGVFLGTLLSDLLTTFWYQPLILYKKGFQKSSFYYFKDLLVYSLIILFTTTIIIWILNHIVITNLFMKLLIEFIMSFFMVLIVIITLFRKTDNFNYIYDILKKITFNFVSKISRKNKNIE